MPTTETATLEEPASRLHFTYCRPNVEDLQQGDVLDKTRALKSILKEVHPHYLKEDYLQFVVLTQSCDLVRRDGKKCKARYVTLAAVRPLDLVVQREIEKHQNDFAKAAAACSERARQTVERFLERLLNNNEPEYFYFHEAPEFGFSESTCAFLHLSIALKADDHYQACLEARQLSLKPVFQAKLGWLVGNMYSRVGTDDWVPVYCTRAEFKKRIESFSKDACKWVDDKRLKAASKLARNEKSLVSADMEAVRRFIDATTVPNRRKIVLDRVAAVLEELGMAPDPKTQNAVRVRLNNDPQFAANLP